MASDQESGMAGAVDEQPGGDVAMFARADRGDAAPPVAQYVDDMVRDMAHAQSLRRVARQQCRQLSGVEMIGIVGRALIVRHPALTRRQLAVAKRPLRRPPLPDCQARALPPPPPPPLP